MSFIPLNYSIPVAVLMIISNAQAQTTANYFDGHENRTMTVQSENYIPNHPECTKNLTPLPLSSPIIATPITKITTPKVETDSDDDGVFDTLDQCPDTKKGYKVDTKGCPRSVTLHLNFETGSSILPKSSDQEIHTLTEFLQENPAATIMITGHTDNVGKADKNMVLSKARADALATRLITDGIETSRIKTFGKGLSEPTTTNQTKEGRAFNRRINIEIR